MSIVLFVLGAIVLGYWLLSMKEPYHNRPLVIMEHGGKIVLVGLAFIVIGFLL